MVASATRNRSHRGELVVKDVLDATLEELARVGYRALRFEEVAARAGVNRTTIYRRWPTKVALVCETVCTLCGATTELVDNGSLRADLLALAHRMIGSFRSAEGQVLVRMLMTEGTEPEVREVIDAVRSEKENSAFAIIERGKARGEIRPEISAELVLTLLVGGIHHRLHVLGRSPEDIDLGEHVDALLGGVGPR